MKLMKKGWFLLGLTLLAQTLRAENLPDDFVYLRDIDSTIVQDMRYAGNHNFLGRPIKGYMASECILTKRAAEALKQVQADLKQQSLSLKVYDCYRPQRAVTDFVVSSKDGDMRMKKEFYPHINKEDFFKLGYVAEKSGHTRGSTVDLTIINIPARKEPAYHRGQKLSACTASLNKRFHDNSIEMGTGYDCLDPKAHIDNTSITDVAFHNRSVLRAVMEKYGFTPYKYEWWHFTLTNESHPNHYYDFPVE